MYVSIGAAFLGALRFLVLAGHSERGKSWERAYWWERQEIPSTIHEALGITEEK